MYRDKYAEVTVIADSTNIVNKFRKYYPESLPGFDKKVLVIFRKDFETLIESNKKRNIGRVVPDDAMERLWERWEEPTADILALYDEVIEIKDWFPSPNVNDEFHYN